LTGANLKGIILVAAGFGVLLVLLLSGVLTPLMGSLFRALTGESSPNPTNEPYVSESPSFSASPQPSKNITISYRLSTAQSIRTLKGSAEPDPDNMFLKATITIVNNGYDSGFNTNPALFTVESNNSEYSVDTLGTGVLDDWSTLGVTDGETYSGTLAFQVPSLATSFELGYYQPISVSRFRIVWIQG